MNEKLVRILLTGGTGFFGRALLRNWFLATRGTLVPLEVLVITRSPENFLYRYPEFKTIDGLRFHIGDVLNPETFPHGQLFTHVLHAAADSTFGPRLSPLERYTQIVEGTRNMLDYAVEHNIPRFLLTSSGGVYGQQPHDMLRITEDYTGMADPLNVKNAYSVAKRCAEHLCALYHDRHGLQSVIARCFAFVGRDLPFDVHFAIGNFIRDALKAPEIIVGGDGTPVRSYMDQRDLSHWLFSLLQFGKAGEAYNVGSDSEICIHDLAYLVRDTLAPHKLVRIAGNSSSDQSVRNRYVPSIAKARTELGLDLNYTLEDSIREAAYYAS